MLPGADREADCRDWQLLADSSPSPTSILRQLGAPLPMSDTGWRGASPTFNTVQFARETDGVAKEVSELDIPIACRLLGEFAGADSVWCLSGTPHSRFRLFGLVDVRRPSTLL